MNRWRADLDRLVAATAALRAIEQVCERIRTKVTEQAVRRYAKEGQTRWKSPNGGLISIVRPPTHNEVVSRTALVDWLNRNGHDDLVIQRVTVVDERALARAYAVAVAGDPDSNHAARRLLLSAVEVVQEPVADVYEQLERRIAVHEVGPQTDAHALTVRKVVTSDGKLIPGLNRVTPAPSTIQVRPSAALRFFAEQRCDPTIAQAERRKTGHVAS